MKKWMTIILISILSFGLASCSNQDDAAVEDFVREYKVKQYTVTDPMNPPDEVILTESMEKYLSEDAYINLAANRFYSVAPDLAKKLNASIELKDINLEEVKTEEGVTSYKYILELLFDNGTKTETVERKGELSITTAEEFVITRDWENKITEIWGEKF